MDKAFALLAFTDEAIRLPAGSARSGRSTEDQNKKQGAEDPRLAGILLDFVRMRRGNPSSGR